MNRELVPLSLHDSERKTTSLLLFSMLLLKFLRSHGDQGNNLAGDAIPHQQIERNAALNGTNKKKKEALQDGMLVVGFHNGGHSWKTLFYRTASLAQGFSGLTIRCFYFWVINKVCKQREAPEVGHSRPAGRRESVTAVIRPASVHCSGQ